MAAQHPSHAIAYEILDEILHDFRLQRQPHGSTVNFVGNIPNTTAAKSQKINLPLIGAIPALANAIAATQIYEARGGQTQSITVDLGKGHNYLDPDIGMTPTINGQEIPLGMIVGNPFLGGIYETADGRYAVPSAVYVDLVYQWSTFLGCAVNNVDVAAAIKRWNSSDLETAAAQAGLPFALIQSESTWPSTPQGNHLSTLPIPLSPNPKRPLEGLKVLCATHAIAGPSAGRTLAEHGATVLQIMYTHGFEHQFVYIYANLGSTSSRLNFQKSSDRKQTWNLISEADVWIDSYRQNALSKFGFTDEEMHEVDSSLIISHVRVYGTTGPWANKAGFDMQGSASSGMMALCGHGVENSAWPPGQVINDYTTGYYGALAIQAAVLRRMREGGGYIVSPSLTGTAMSIVRYFQSSREPILTSSMAPALPPDELELRTGMGVLRTLRPLPVLSRTPAGYEPVTLGPMGCALPVWWGYDVGGVRPLKREVVVEGMKKHSEKRTDELKRVAMQYRRLALSIL